MDPEAKQQQAPQSPWHTLTTEGALEHVRSASTGLTTTEAARRLGEFGPNELHARKSVSAWETFVDQFKNVLILILLSATIVSGFLGHTLEAAVITVIVLFAVLLGFIQEYRAERALEALRQMAAPTARVVRDGEEVVLPARELVPGDVFVLRTGDRIPADARILRRSISPSTRPRSPANPRPVEKTNGASRRCASCRSATAEHGLCGHARRPTGAARRRRRHRHVHRVRPHRPDGADASKPAARRCRKTSTASARRSARPRSRWSRSSSPSGLCAGCRPSRCSCSASRWRWRWCPRRCRRWSRSRSRSACGEWSGAGARPPAAGRRDARQHLGHLLGQDGHADKNEMTVRQLFVGRQLFELSGRRLRPTGEFSDDGCAASRRPAGVRAAAARGVLASDARLVQRATAAGTSRATPPKAR